MLTKLVLYNSKHALNRDILSTFSAIVLGSKTDVSTAPLFNIVKAFCGTRFEDRLLSFYIANALCKTTSGLMLLLLSFHIANALR